MRRSPPPRPRRAPAAPSHPRTRPTSRDVARPLLAERGQAAVDHVTIVLLVAAVLLAGAGIAAASGRDVAGAVISQIHRALCIVRGGECARDLVPCVVATSSRTERDGVTIAVARFGDSRVILREVLSDGRVVVTLLEDADHGAEAAVGASAQIGDLVSVGAEARGAIVSRNGGGKTWILPSAEEADRLLDVIGGRTVGKILSGSDAVPPPDETTTQHGWGLDLSGSADIPGLVTLVGGAEAHDVDGGRVDRLTGRTVLYLSRSSNLSVELSHEIAGGGSVGASGSVDVTWAIETDRRGRPTGLVHVESGPLTASGDLPDAASPVAGALVVPAGDGAARRYEVERHLDLTDAANREAAREFVARVLDGRPRPGRERAPTGGALGARLREHATIHARTYAVAGEEDGVALSGALGVKLAVESTTATATSRLLSAMTRGPGGVWRRRADCLGEV